MPTPPPSPHVVAAVDLGSSSFHMAVARVEGGRPTILDRIKERLQIAAGLDAHGALTADTQERALACLERFGQRLRDMPPGSVRAVGTNTLRLATNAHVFVRRATKALGHAIEVISGKEEARLIYLGVAHDTHHGPARRLVVDIGGGSTECIVGQGYELLASDSLQMGCVSYSKRFFPGGRIRREGMKKALIAARLELEGIETRYRSFGWDVSIGSSGTIQAIEEILQAERWSEGGITPRGLKRLRKALLDAGSASALSLRTLKPDRAPTLAGGTAILSAAFEAFEVERMISSAWALQEGVLYDLVGRIQQEDVRDHTIRAFAERYQVDPEQAARVERTALGFLDQAAESWDLPSSARRLLAWAALLHEVGISISYTGYHKHGAYLAANSDLPGFSREDQQMIAALIRSHRRRIDDHAFDGVPSQRRVEALRLAVLLRLAVRLNRGRSPRALPRVGLRTHPKSISLDFPARFLAAHPLTRAELEEEASYLEEAGLRLHVG